MEEGIMCELMRGIYGIDGGGKKESDFQKEILLLYLFAQRGVGFRVISFYGNIL